MSRNIALAGTRPCRQEGQRGPGAQVLEEQRLHHRDGRQAQRRVHRAVRRERLPPDVEDGVHPPGADVPEVGRIIYSSAHVDFNKAFADWNAAIAQGVDVIVTYPDFGDAMIPVMKKATDAGIPVATYAWGYVSDPGKNYLTVVGEDTCVTGKTYAYIMNNQVKSGKIAFLGGFAGNPLSEGWQKCEEPALRSSIDRRREGADELESVQGAAGRGRNPREESRHQGLELRVRARHGPGWVRGIQGRGQAVQHRPDTPHGRRRHGLPLQPAQEPEARDVLLQLRQLADPGRLHGRDDEAQGGEDPADRSCSRSSCRTSGCATPASRAIRRRPPRRRSSR